MTPREEWKAADRLRRRYRRRYGEVQDFTGLKTTNVYWQHGKRVSLRMLPGAYFVKVIKVDFPRYGVMRYHMEIV